MALSPEVYLVSSVILNADYQVALKHGAVPDMFHVHRDEWDWIVKYYGKFRKTPTRNAFRVAFPKFGLKDVDDTGHFVEEVRKSHAQQELTELMSEQANLLAKGQVTQAADLGLSGITKIAAGMGSHEEIDPLTDWKPIYNEVKARKARYDELGRAGIPTGFATLDERTGGVGLGQSWIVAARLGQGKSFALLQMAATALIAGHSVHFAALEMSRQEVTMRLHNLLSSEVGLRVFQSTQLAQGKNFDLKVYRNFLEQLPKHVAGKLTVSDTQNLGEMEIASQIERSHPDIYFLDYMTLATTKGDGGWQDIGNFSKAIKNMSRRYNCAMVSAAQLNRQGTDKAAGAETIGGSDKIGQDADAVIMLSKRSTRITEMKLAKYRHGRDGFKWWSFLDLETGTRKELSKDQAMDVIDQDKDRTDEEESKATVPAKKPPLRVIRSIQGEQQEAAYMTGNGKKPLKPLKRLPKA